MTPVLINCVKLGKKFTLYHLPYKKLYVLMLCLYKFKNRDIFTKKIKIRLTEKSQLSLWLSSWYFLLWIYVTDVEYVLSAIEVYNHLVFLSNIRSMFITWTSFNRSELAIILLKFYKSHEGNLSQLQFIIQN